MIRARLRHVLILVMLPAPVFANDACGSLHAEDAVSILGGAVNNSISEHFSGGGMMSYQCRYAANESPVRYADLSITRYENKEMFDMLYGDSEPGDEPVADLGERALWHSGSGSLSVFVGLEVLTLHVFRQDRELSRDDHIELMRRVLERR